MTINVGSFVGKESWGTPARIGRESIPVTLLLDTAEGTTAKFDMENAAGGTIYIPTGSPITTLTFWAAPLYGGTFLALYDSLGAAVTMTVSAAKAYDLPAALYGVGAVKIVVNAQGTVIVSLKG